MKHLSFLMLLVLAWPLAAKERAPNIVLIMADDLGHDDLSLHGHPHIHTPNLVKIASQSVQFTDFSVTPVCSTTRAALLTGRHPYKTGVSGVHGGRDFMHRKETLISQYLQQAGYRTGLWGKWHIGKTDGYFPWDRGFDEAYYSELYQHQDNYGWLNGQLVEHQGWASQVVTDYALDFITRAGEQPFFAYVSYLAPHEPWLAPKSFVDKHLKAGLRPAIANLYGMIEEMDAQIGRLYTHLEKNDLLDNTLIVFLSDNGPWWDSSNFGAMTQQEWADRNPGKLKGNKGQTWQNGIKSPLFFHLPSTFTPAKVNRYVDVKDIFPTLLELADAVPDAPLNDLDGLSFLPYLQGETNGENPRSTLIASHDVVSAKPGFNQWTPVDEASKEQMIFHNQIIGLRTEQYKLILNPAMDRKGYPQPTGRYLLFDMQSDPLESTNLFAKKPEIATAMRGELEQAFVHILSNPASFAPPVYLVGKDSPISVVNGFGPSATSGSTHSHAHHLGNMKSLGDRASYQLDVKASGRHELLFTQDNLDSAGMLLKITLGSQTITAQLNGTLQQKLGSFELTPGPATLSIEVLKNNSVKPWSAITGLRRLLLVKHGDEKKLTDFTYPH